MNLIRFHGVLAPNAKLRSQILPAPAERVTEPPTDHAQGQGKTPRMSWARLLKRVFDIDIEHCPNCGLPVLWQTGGALKIIAADLAWSDPTPVQNGAPVPGKYSAMPFFAQQSD